MLQVRHHKPSFCILTTSVFPARGPADRFRRLPFVQGSLQPNGKDQQSIRYVINWHRIALDRSGRHTAYQQLLVFILGFFPGAIVSNLGYPNAALSVVLAAYGGA
ncbi:hypothetical protein ACU4I5_24225 (plasmid) [Ensifer adhaerens]